ncbi:MAG: TonB-dependent receptor, partial [Deltaproteobacteria bacterium]|nr:TonB-dependent receptor [Deltaproteobacteria bacterium]
MKTHLHRRATRIGPVVLVLATMVWSGLLPNAAAQEDEFEELEMEIFFAPAETVTTAARHSQPLLQSPSAVTVITREDIETSGARTLPEALRLVPNMDVNQVKPMWYSLGVRGLTYINSDSILLMIDGHDVTFEYFGFPMWTIQHISMDDVERIEVIRGPGSALYGANAFSGVVNVITREPGNGPRAMVSLRGGERGQLELACRGTEKFGPVALSVSAGVERENLWTAQRSNARNVVHGRLSGKIDLGTDASLKMATGLYSGSGGFYTNIGETTIHSGWNFFATSDLKYDDLLVRVAYDIWSFDIDFGMKLYFPELDLVLAEVPRTDARLDKFVFNPQHSIEIFHNRFTYGAEYVLNYYKSDLLVDPSQSE